MGRIDAAIATLLLNSLWHITLVAGLTWAVILPVRSPAARHRLWALSLMASLILPLASVVPRHHAKPLPASSVTVGETARSRASGVATPAWSVMDRTAHQEVATVSVLPTCCSWFGVSRWHGGLGGPHVLFARRRPKCASRKSTDEQPSDVASHSGSPQSSLPAHRAYGSRPRSDGGHQSSCCPNGSSWTHRSTS